MSSRSVPFLRRARRPLLGTIGLAGFLAAWQVIPMVGLVDREYLPYPTDVGSRLAREALDLAFWRRLGLTVQAWAIGLAIASLAAVVLGTVIGLVPFLRRATHTTVEFLRPIPSVAIVPVAVIIQGITIEAALIITVYAAFWQMFVQVLYGVADVDTVARDTARGFGLTPIERLTRLVLPTALPYVMTGLRLAASVALILAITAEMVIGNPGLGTLIMMSRSTPGDAAGLYAFVVVAGLLGIAINAVFALIERRVLHWHQSVRGEGIL